MNKIKFIVLAFVTMFIVSCSLHPDSDAEKLADLMKSGKNAEIEEFSEELIDRYGNNTNARNKFIKHLEEYGKKIELDSSLIKKYVDVNFMK